METTFAKQSNPLAKYFRQPAIHMKLPSGGAYWPEGSIEIPLTGELPIYPMTTRDEITLRTPDALMNGSGVVDVIQSCCPAIKDAWKMPNIDVDAVLIAIRIASYGNSMDVDTKCPHCGEANKHGLDLQNCLGSISSPNYNNQLESNGLKIKFKPVTYFGANKESSVDFEQQKMMQALERADLDEETRAQEIYNSMQRLISINTNTLSNSTDYIEMPDGDKVRQPEFISEFYNNAPGVLVKEIQTKLSQFNIAAGIKAQIVTCGECKVEYQVPVVFDYAAFFGNGS